MNKLTHAAWVLALLAFTQVSCKKETGSVGLDTGDSGLQPLEIDSFTLITRTVTEDSLRSDNTTHQMLGATRTTDYGYTSSSCAVSFVLPSSSFAFPAGVQIDSVVFQGVYTGTDQFVGNLNTAMTIQAGEIAERIYVDSAYYSNRTMNTLSSAAFTGYRHDLDDSVYVVENGVTRAHAPHLRLKMGTDVLNKFINAQPSDLGSNTAFQDYFHGIKLSVDGSGLVNGQGNIVYLNFNHAESGLAVYFNDTGKYVFPVGKNGAKINLYQDDFSSLPQIQNQLTAVGSSFDITYVQSMAGLKTRVDIPNLLDLVDNGVYAILSASVRFYYDDANTSPEFPAFTRMILVKRDSLGRNDFVADQLLNSAAYGGTKNADGYYEFNITREIQGILTTRRLTGSNTNTGFYLIAPSDNPMSASHLTMDMKKGQPRGVKFVIKVAKTK